MKSIEEVLRLIAPGPRPQPLALDGDTLWIGAWDTQRLYAMDPLKWTLKEEATAPGRPFGMTVLGDELRVIVADAQDDRYIHRFIPGHGFKNDAMPCPDKTGSHLAYDGDTLFVSQLDNRRIISLDAAGNVIREIPVTRYPCGMTIFDGCFYLLTGDEDLEDIRLTRLNARGDRPEETDLASVPFAARALAYDGQHFWTSHRDNNEIVSFLAER